MTRKLSVAFITLGLVAAMAGPAAAQRLTDKGVDLQGKQVKAGFDAWKAALEKTNLDDANVKNAAGTVEVKDFLAALAKDIDAFNDAFKTSRAANAQAQSLLRKASDVEIQYRVHGGPTLAAWTPASLQFRALAYAYGAAWPATVEAVANRLTDKDVQTLFDDAGRLAKRLKGPVGDAAKTSTAVDKAARETMALEFDSLTRVAKQTFDKMKAGEAADNDERQVLAVAHSIAQKVKTLELTGPAKADWDALNVTLTAIAKSFNDQWDTK